MHSDFDTNRPVRKAKVGDRDVKLTFHPSEDNDAISKTIRPNKIEYIDVLFLDFTTGTIKVVPGTKRYGADWRFPETLDDICRDHADYFLKIQVTAKAKAATITRELKFHYNGLASTLELMPENYDALSGVVTSTLRDVSSA